MAGAAFTAQRDLPRVTQLASDLDRRLDPDQARALAQYVELVSRWNTKLDLTAARGAAAQVEVLLADALILSELALCPQGARLLDVGSGAGAPVVPLLLLRPDLSAQLVEPQQKRAAFLRTALVRLGLGQRARVEQQRIDSAAEAPQWPADVALSRATFAPEVWLPLGLGLAPSALVLLASSDAPAAPEGSRVVTELGYRLPSSGAARRVVRYLRV